MELKHIAFFAMLFIGVPIAMAMLKDNLRLQKMAYFLMILFIPFVYSTGINFFTDEFYFTTLQPQDQETESDPLISLFRKKRS